MTAVTMHAMGECSKRSPEIPCLPGVLFGVVCGGGSGGATGHREGGE
ncbi:hypothetical protein [uncultured Desulfuromonas sp.]|nr:hypothetical protein [uncultured Desulfuromonas sp.]